MQPFCIRIRNGELHPLSVILIKPGQFVVIPLYPYGLFFFVYTQAWQPFSILGDHEFTERHIGKLRPKGDIERLKDKLACLIRI
jgi:hypothetical protein